MSCDAAARPENHAVTAPATSTASTSAPSRHHGSANSIVQWKLCGLTTFTSTTLTASPSASPSSAPTAVHSAPSAQTSVSTCARVVPRCCSAPNSRRRASTCDEKLAAMPNSPITIATACSQTVTAKLRSKMASETARISAGVAISSSAGSAASARKPVCTGATAAPGVSHSARSLTLSSPVSRCQSLRSMTSEPCWRA